MPGMDHTGPMGQGPMTGRRMGCSSNFGARFRRRDQIVEGDQETGQAGDVPGRGLGWGRGRGGPGRGMGWGNRFRGGRI